ncbi:MAG: flagellar biosynthesis anti-sigma factor FlgM [bacterium]|nr:flagellar biosynthesis anti-sigma factor FlgM [bacterium]
MKINNYLSSAQELQSRLSKINKKEQTQSGSTESIKTNVDAVNIDAVRKDEASAASNKAKVAELKAAVANGTYKPNIQEVAKAVIRDLFA